MTATREGDTDKSASSVSFLYLLSFFVWVILLSSYFALTQILNSAYLNPL